METHPDGQFDFADVAVHDIDNKATEAQLPLDNLKRMGIGIINIGKPKDTIIGEFERHLLLLTTTHNYLTTTYDYLLGLLFQCRIQCPFS